MKAWLRKELFAKRKAAHAERAAKDPAANARLLAEIGDSAGKIVAAYRPIRTEVDPTEAMIALCEAGARVTVPVIDGEARPLIFREWTPEVEMVDGPFGAKVPASGEDLRPNIIIAPLLGWDRKGWRLGYGGGFYDRSLEALRKHQDVRAIGFGYAAQECGEVPVEKTDQQLDAMVTEAETIIFEAS
ncbi:MAG: 5-formyltetrahydrofolate cyclo-ligase [Pseudomonadota bacterium]